MRETRNAIVSFSRARFFAFAASCLVLLVLVCGLSSSAQPSTSPSETTATTGRNVHQDKKPGKSLLDPDHGKRLFMGHCARCHGVQGAGGTGANLRRPKLRHAASDKDLFDVIRKGIPGTAMPNTWAMTDHEIRQVAGYVRSLGLTAVEPLPGDPKKGEFLYHKKGQCANCHIVSGYGGSSGPDLTEVGARRGLTFLREAILHPGKDRPLDRQGYAEWLVVVAFTKDGRFVTGRRVNEDTFTIQMRDDKNRLHSFRKRDLEKLVHTKISLMPSAQKMFSPSEIDDLISYLATLRGEQ